MAFDRPTLTQLKSTVAADIQSSLQGSDALLRFSSLKISGVAMAHLAHDQYGYLDYIAAQSVPWTATEENAYAWGALKGVTPGAAVAATNGAVTFSGENDKVIPAGTQMVWGGVTYTVDADATVVGGQVVVNAAASTAGADGNAPVGAVMTLGVAIEGINSNGAVTTAFTDGADAEDPDTFKTRMLAAYAQPPQGGAQSDYVGWAKQAPGVTRAWCKPMGMGPGTVVVYVMMDQVEAAHNGFPQGSNGCASGEARAATASGDQLAVADYIYPLRPVQSLVYVCSPIPAPVNFTIAGISGASDSVKAAVAAALAGVCTQNQVLPGVSQTGGQATYTVNLAPFEAALAAVSGAVNALISAPAGNITLTIGQLPVVGTITYD